MEDGEGGRTGGREGGRKVGREGERERWRDGEGAKEKGEKDSLSGCLVVLSLDPLLGLGVHKHSGVGTRAGFSHSLCMSVE